jgi:hypothetical protein
MSCHWYFEINASNNQESRKECEKRTSFFFNTGKSEIMPNTAAAVDYFDDDVIRHIYK